MNVVRALLNIQTKINKQQGGISAAFAFILIGLISVLALVVELAGRFSDQSKLSAANDAAAYSASNSQSAQKDAQAIFLSNTQYLSDRGYQAGKIHLSVSENGEVQTRANLIIPKRWGNTAVTQEAGVELVNYAKVAVDTTTIEVAIMLDISDSMRGHIEGIQEALGRFGDIMFADEGRNQNKSISIVPASGLVNIGNYPHFFTDINVPFSAQSVAQEYNIGSLLHPSVPGRTRQDYCAELQEITDGYQRPNQITSNWVRKLENFPGKEYSLKLHQQTDPLQRGRYGDNVTPLKGIYSEQNPKSTYNPNFQGQLALFDSDNCEVSKITAHATSLQEFQQGIQQLYVGFHTNTAEGVLWSWRLLSPQWRGRWHQSKPNLPRAYQHSHNHKALILFADGEHKINPVVRDKKQAQLCRVMKQKGIDIYVIGYGNDVIAQKQLRACASQNQFYQADKRNIEQVFSRLAQSINEKRLID